MKNLELAYLAVAYGMTAIIFRTARHAKFPTFSHMALENKSTRQVFFWGLLISGIIFAFLMYDWAIPHFGLGIFAKIIVGLIVVCVTMTGFFPVEGPRFSGLHLIFGIGLGICMFILVVSLALTHAIHPLARMIDGLLAIGMVVLAATTKRIKSGEYLLHEKLFFGFWHAAIFAMVYFG